MKVFAPAGGIPINEPSVFAKVRSWFRYTFNKDHRRLVREAFNSRPWDHSFLFSLERAKIEEMANYLEKAGRFVGVEYVVRDMRICLSLLDIMLGERQLFHYDGQLMFKEVDEAEEKELGEKAVEIIESPDFKYNCDVKVNLRNMKRFVDNEKLFEFYQRLPHELYELKAEHLYHKIRATREMRWWD